MAINKHFIKYSALTVLILIPWTLFLVFLSKTTYNDALSMAVLFLGYIPPGIFFGKLVDIEKKTMVAFTVALVQFPTILVIAFISGRLGVLTSESYGLGMVFTVFTIWAFPMSVFISGVITSPTKHVPKSFNHLAITTLLLVLWTLLLILLYGSTHKYYALANDHALIIVVLFLGYIPPGIIFGKLANIKRKIWISVGAAVILLLMKNLSTLLLIGDSSFYSKLYSYASFAIWGFPLGALIYEFFERKWLSYEPKSWKN